MVYQLVDVVVAPREPGEPNEIGDPPGRSAGRGNSSALFGCVRGLRSGFLSSLLGSRAGSIARALAAPSQVWLVRRLPQVPRLSRLAF